MSHYLRAEWPAPPVIHTCITTRQGGYSRGSYASFNLAAHVGDDITNVQKNRAKLCQDNDIPDNPKWLQQVHGTAVVKADQINFTPEADACFADKSGMVCVVLTADCLPILLCDLSGHWVAAIHAGWRGLAAGIIEKTLEKYLQPKHQLLAYLCPAISQAAFEVGAEVREQFMQTMPEASNAFQPSHESNKWLADIYLLAKQRLLREGVQQIYGGELCTYFDASRFFSYRRDGQTGRMANLIWIQS